MIPLTVPGNGLQVFALRPLNQNLILYIFAWVPPRKEWLARANADLDKVSRFQDRVQFVVKICSSLSVPTFRNSDVRHSFRKSRLLQWFYTRIFLYFFHISKDQLFNFILVFSLYIFPDALTTDFFQKLCSLCHS